MHHFPKAPDKPEISALSNGVTYTIAKMKPAFCQRRSIFFQHDWLKFTEHPLFVAKSYKMEGFSYLAANIANITKW